jgi:hypothetical protein
LYSRAMLCRIWSLALVALAIVPISSQSKPVWQKGQERRDACIAGLSSFAVDPSMAKKPQFADDFDGVILEYSSSGCYGNCPAFKMRIENNRAVWEGHAFVRKKKRVEKRISPEVLRRFVREWLDDNFYAMRDEYCNPTCPDGTLIMATDLNETTIGVKASSYAKTVSQCSVKANIEPKPPDQYFRLSHDLVEFAKSNGWL